MPTDDPVLMQTDYTVIEPDGTKTHGVVEWPAKPGFRTIAAVVEPVLHKARPGADLERVLVFWDGKYADMFVDDCGQMLNLPVNPEATKVYHNNVRVHDPEHAYDARLVSIHGIAVLFNRRVWH